MHDFIEKLKEALSHTTIESIFGHPIAEAIGGFAGSVAAHIVAGFILAGFAIGIGWFAWFELPGRLKAWAIRRGDRNRLNILLGVVLNKTDFKLLRRYDAHFSEYYLNERYAY